MDTAKVPRRSDADQLSEILNSTEVAQLVGELEATRWTGRPGYPIRTIVGMALAKSIYSVPTWTRTVRLVCEHAALRLALGCASESDVPSEWACYRFTAKLRRFKPLLDACLDRVTASLHGEMPEMGQDVAIDASDLPAYANGGSSARAEGSASGSPTPTPPGATAPLSRRGRAAGSTGTSSTPLSARARACRSRGRSSRRGRMNRRSRPR